VIVAAVAEKYDLLANSAYTALWEAYAETVIPTGEGAAKTHFAAKIKLSVSCIND
jgi:spore coat protein U-like protein